MGTKVTFIGAGSTIFALSLLQDICWYDSLSDVEVVLYDIDHERLETTYKIGSALFNSQPTARSLSIRATLDKQDAIRDANFVMVMFQIGGYSPSTKIDFEIPRSFGLHQTIGDTLGVGGVMRALRTIPPLLDIAVTMEQYTQNALLINYANPMAMNCWALSDSSSIKSIGLCHSIPYTTEQLASDLQLPPSELDYLVAGINHMAFYLKLEHHGSNLYPRLNQFIKSNTEFPPKRPTLGKDMVDHIRYDLMCHLGYFVTESSEHLSEYLPWYIKSQAPELIEQFSIPLDEYLRRCEYQIAEWNEHKKQIDNGTYPLTVERSHDYGIAIIEAMVNKHPQRVYVNTKNNGLITNLPAECVVEVPALIDQNGVQPTFIGSLPHQLAALIQTNINVQQLTVAAIQNKCRDHVYHAVSLDPHTASELTLQQIREMTDKLLDAHGDMIQL